MALGEILSLSFGIDPNDILAGAGYVLCPLFSITSPFIHNNSTLFLERKGTTRYSYVNSTISGGTGLTPWASFQRW